MNIFNKFDRLLDKCQLYFLAEKLRGFEFRVTGDIDDPAWIEQNKELLSEWISLAGSIGTKNPILYVTATQNFQEAKQSIYGINSNVKVAIHGLKHIYYTKLKASEILSDLEKEVTLSSSHRYPYLDWSLTSLWCASEYFKTDSSIVSSWMYPFKIYGMTEYPITPPTDTALRNKPVSKSVVKLYRNLINFESKTDRPLTLLLHPNVWSVELLRQLSL
jgi:hypothetical protein